MVAFSTGPTAVKNGSAWRNYVNGRKHTTHTAENFDVVEELVLSQEDASVAHTTERHFEHKDNDIIVNLTFPCLNLCFYISF